MDIKELVFSHRQQRIERKLVKCYAKEIALTISRLVEKNCQLHPRTALSNSTRLPYDASGRTAMAIL